MKDVDSLDTLLAKHPAKPKRPLSANFTEVVADRLQEHPTLNLWQRLHVAWPSSLLGKAGLASLAAVVLLSGSVAALALWPHPSVTPSIHQELPSGNHIVGYNAENCKYFDTLDGSPIKQTKESLYYEIRQGSKLTDQQLQDSLRAVCEENLSNNAMSNIVKQLPQNLPGMGSTVAYTITAISSGSITLTPDSHYALDQYNIKQNITYTRFANNLLMYNQDNKTSYDDFKVGDTVKLVVQDASKTPASLHGTADHNDNVMNHPEHITILGMIKIPPLTADPNIFYRSVGTDLVRLDPCTSSPTGFCRAYDFAN